MPLMDTPDLVGTLVEPRAERLPLFEPMPLHLNTTLIWPPRRGGRLLCGATLRNLWCDLS